MLSSSQSVIDVPWRIALVVLSLAGWLLLATARTLDPDPRGFGTHEQLGLTPCLFQETTGLACPACGSTTAWAYVARGQLSSAATANLGGTLLALTVVVLGPWAVLVALKGRWLLVEPTLPMALIFGGLWLAIMILDWVRRLYFV